jgi:hypothetical protein
MDRPRFLGHLTRYGRVIEFVASNNEEGRHTTLDDLDICQQALHRPHAHEINHRDTNEHILSYNYSLCVTLVNVDIAELSAPGPKMDKELHGSEQLPNTSGRDGVCDSTDC